MIGPSTGQFFPCSGSGDNAIADAVGLGINTILLLIAIPPYLVTQDLGVS